MYIPSTVQTAEEIALYTGLPVKIIKEKLGITKKPIPSEEDHTCEMGIRAAKIALENSGIHPEEIDLVMYIGEEYKEYPLWTAGIKLQEAIGAKNAWAFDVAQRCGTTVMALKVAKDMMIADESIRTVLLAGGYRNGDFINYKNERTRFMYNLGAGGGAIILQKDSNKNRVLESSMITDGTFSEDVVVVAGGTKHPLTELTLKEGLYQLDVLDPAGMKARLEQKSMVNFLKVIKQALQKSGYQEKDIDYLAMLHMKVSAHQYVLKELNLSEEQSIYLHEYGHIGQFDQILSLQLAEQAGKVKDGSIVVLVSAGIGYAWGATVIQWGRG
ncbi:MAG: 3-oxoacyl-ACP synthase [Bacillaceae bacterium]